MMTVGEARAIFDNLEGCQRPIETKGLAIKIIMDMKTHNSVTKAQLLKAMNWMWDQMFEYKREEDKNEVQET